VWSPGVRTPQPVSGGDTTGTPTPVGEMTALAAPFVGGAVVVVATVVAWGAGAMVVAGGRLWTAGASPPPPPHAAPTSARARAIRAKVGPGKGSRRSIVPLSLPAHAPEHPSGGTSLSPLWRGQGVRSGGWSGRGTVSG